MKYLDDTIWILQNQWNKRIFFKNVIQNEIVWCKQFGQSLKNFVAQFACKQTSLLLIIIEGYRCNSRFIFNFLPMQQQNMFRALIIDTHHTNFQVYWHFAVCMC